jgi:GNAT superfamily N-acetyltransferase
MSLEVLTREAMSEDIGMISALTKTLWVDHAKMAADLQKIEEVAQYDFAAHVNESFENPNERWFVAEAEGRTIGAVRTEESRRIPLYTHDRVLAIDDIAVLSSFRCQGVGRALVQTCIDYAESRGIGLLKAMIYEWNAPSGRLFTSMGFEPRHADYYLVR